MAKKAKRPRIKKTAAKLSIKGPLSKKERTDLMGWLKNQIAVVRSQAEAKSYTAGLNYY